MKAMTTKEFLAAFRMTPEQRRLRDIEIEKDAALANESERPLVQEINAQGWEITSVWDLYNYHTDHESLVPLLLSHLPRDYHPKIKIAIVGSLVNVKAISSDCSRVLIDELKQAFGRTGGLWEGVQQSLAYALSELAHRSVEAELRTLVVEQQGSFFLDGLERALKRSGRKR